MKFRHSEFLDLLHLDNSQIPLMLTKATFGDILVFQEHFSAGVGRSFGGNSPWWSLLSLTEGHRGVPHPSGVGLFLCRHTGIMQNEYSRDEKHALIVYNRTLEE